MISPWKILHGDCLAEMEWLANESVDSIVTDPPYDLTSKKRGGSGVASINLDSPYGRSRIGTGNGAGGFMGMHWDSTGIAFDPEVWIECLRALKPGGHLLAFGGTRTYHRMACAIEDAGFEIRDQIGWTYGSGFPKSHNGPWGGTALKPAWEPIVMARKPIVGTVAQNFERYGVGGLNIDGCRVEHTTVDGGSLATNPHLRSHINGGNGGHIISTETDRRVVVPHTQGRFPANLIHDGSDDVLAAFPQAPGQLANASTTAPSEKTDRIYGAMKRQGEPSQDNDNGGAVGFKMKPGARRLDSGSAARFFYAAKANKKDREEGCDELDAIHRVNGNKWTDQDYRVSSGERPPSAESGPRRNTHPTVKPTDLMRYLCRLVTPTNGLVLDPFMGSGSTGKAALLEGFRFIGIERESEYINIARARLVRAEQEGEL